MTVLLLATSFGGSFGYDLAVVENDYAVAQLHDRFHNMLDHDEGDSHLLVDVPQLFQGLVDFHEGEAGHQLVKEQQFRFRCQGRSQNDAPLGSNSQVLHQIVPKSLELGQPQYVIDSFVLFGRGPQV